MKDSRLALVAPLVLALAACGGGADGAPAGIGPGPAPSVSFQSETAGPAPWIDPAISSRFRSRVHLDDLDADRKVDGAVMLDTQEIGVWFGVGNGTFEGLVTFGPVTLPAPLIESAYGSLLFGGDFDGDGKRDIAVARGDIFLVPPVPPEQQVEGWAFVMRGVGTRSFQAGPLTMTTAMDVDEGHESGFAEDFDGDGRTDLLLMDDPSLSPVSYRRGRVFLSDGSLGLVPHRYVTLGDRNATRLVGDFDGNGLPDMLVVPFFTSRADVLLNVGGGDLAWMSELALGPVSGTGYSLLAVDDLNGDGRDDVAVGLFGLGTVSPFLSGPDGSLELQSDAILVTAPEVFFQQVGDVNGDGRGDLIQPGLGVGAGDVGFQLADGSGGWIPANPAVIPSPAPITYPIVLADVDGDGDKDVFFPFSDPVVIFFAGP